MTIISNNQFAEFLTSRPLYARIKAVEKVENTEYNYTNPLDFKDKPFKYRCPYEDQVQTFRTGLFGSEGLYHRDRLPVAGEMPSYFDAITKVLNLSVYLIGHCQSCKKQIQFLVKVTSDKSWDRLEEGIDIFIQKTGQWPAHEIDPDSIVINYLTKEDNDNYKKALICLSFGYGIGAYAYFRRIIENEIKRIVKDISQMDFEGADK